MKYLMLCMFKVGVMVGIKVCAVSVSLSKVLNILPNLNTI